ncbi:TPA: hypothetical protein N3282_003639 [Klebsiella aerogenes]|nr:hypothetical protein [Klebsiella aerogenes]
MTDINRLISSLKRRSAHAKEFGDDVTFVKLKDIDALVEALEKAQQRNGELETYSKTALEFREAARDENRHLKLELEIAEKRIAELESRTVTVKLPQAVSAGGQGYQEQVERILTAAGIKWEAE